jgi:hypothetical protein
MKIGLCDPASNQVSDKVRVKVYNQVKDQGVSEVKQNIKL